MPKFLPNRCSLRLLQSFLVREKLYSYDKVKLYKLRNFNVTIVRHLTDSEQEFKASALSAIISKEQPPISKTAPIAQENQHEKEQQKNSETSWKRIKYSLIAFGVSFTCLGGYLIFSLGSPVKDQLGNEIRDDFSDMPIVQQYIYRMLHELDYYKRLIKEPSREKLLPDPLKYPYYQPPFTLVLELTDLLVHPEWTYKTGWRFKKRPGVDVFLETVCSMYEVVIFTAEQGMTVFPIVGSLDPKNLIAYKLVRDATHFVDGHHVKNLEHLNRDLKKVIVVDWNLESVKFHQENVLNIPRWKGNDDDRTLLDLADFLKSIAEANFEDVREVLSHYSQFDDPLQVFRERQRKQIAEQEQAKADKLVKTESVVKKWTPTFLRKTI